MDSLAKIYFFQELDEFELETLKDITSIRDVSPGEVILRQGQPSDALFVVRSGSVRVLLPVPDDMTAPSSVEEQTLVKLGPGECFGEFAFVDGKPSSATVQAAEESSLFVIPADGLHELLAANPQSAVKIYKALLHVLVSRFRNTDIDLAMQRATAGI